MCIKGKKLYMVDMNNRTVLVYKLNRKGLDTESEEDNDEDLED